MSGVLHYTIEKHGLLMKQKKDPEVLLKCGIGGNWKK